MFPTHVGIARRCPPTRSCRRYVPYACGDCAETGGFSRCRWICSLRMWGLRAPCLPRARVQRMFPTHVGIARRHGAAGRNRRHVPYACGDCAFVTDCNCDALRCSLRMWGLRGFESWAIFGCRMFPTHVGIARNVTPGSALPVDVPYACGDCAEHVRKCDWVEACSLRMWGLRVNSRVPHYPHCMFPTHVGIARINGDPARTDLDVPYACGDCASTERIATPGKRCSLRMWGLRGPDAVVAPGRTMFPTHVGIARVKAPTLTIRRYVPYACGDCARAASLLGIGA